MDKACSVFVIFLQPVVGAVPLPVEAPTGVVAEYFRRASIFRIVPDLGYGYIRAHRIEMIEPGLQSHRSGRFSKLELTISQKAEIDP